MISEIIKENMEYFNYSQSDLTKFLNISQKTLSLILNNKAELSVESSMKLDELFNFPLGSLITRQYIIKSKMKQSTSDEVLIKDFLKKTKRFELTQTSSIENIQNNLFSNSLEIYKDNLSMNVLGFSKYKDKPLAYLWIALCQKKHRANKSTGEFKKSTASTVYNKIFKEIFSNETFEKRFESVKKQLSDCGIILRGEPFIPDSTIRGVSLKLSTQRFIFLSDMNKREYEIWLNLIHELIHFYGNFDNEVDEQKIDKHARMLFKTYLDKYNIDKNHEFYQVLEILENEKYEWLREHSKLKASFGDIETLLDIL